jgi:hypothetical protein
LKFISTRPYADPEKPARRMLEIAHAIEPIQGRIHFEKINDRFCLTAAAGAERDAAAHKLKLPRN